MFILVFKSLSMSRIMSSVMITAFLTLDFLVSDKGRNYLKKLGTLEMFQIKKFKIPTEQIYLLFSFREVTNCKVRSKIQITLSYWQTK